MGFPTRHSRAAFGPKFRNAKKLTNPEHDIGDAQFNRLFHQVSGMNLVSAMAYLTAHWDGAAMVLDSHAEAWNPDGSVVSPYDPPVLARSGAGIYSVQYEPQYPDENDELQTIDVQNPRGFLVDYTGAAYIGILKAERTDARTIAVRVYEWQVGTSTDWVLSDRAFWLAWG